MKILTELVKYEETITLIPENKITNVQTIFHCYWNGNLSKKHLYSIESCYHFNKNHKIILWLENNQKNKYNDKINKFAEIKEFNLKNETKNTFLENYEYKFNHLTFYSDYIRLILLYKYGGCWFDLDVFFLRNFDILFETYKDEICLYQWEYQNYPNNAIFFSLDPLSEKMKRVILFFIQKNKGWGFQQSNTTYSDDVDLLVLPCSWFDPGFLTNGIDSRVSNFFKNTEENYNFDNFYKGSFCYHWHNKWNDNIEKMSTAKQLYNLLKKIRIAIMIPICSRGQNFQDFNQIPLLTTFLPNFEKTKSEKFEYNFYIGYDDDDDFYIKNQENLEKLNMKIFELNNCQHAPAFAWNKLFEIAYKDGNDFFFQIGDDVELKSQNWAEVFIEKLNSNNGIGVVGPCDLTNYFQRVNHDKPYVIENSFVSRKHYEIFGYFFYPTIKNWFCDTWITEIYRPFLTHIFTDKIVQNKIRDNRYKIEYVSELNKLIEISREKIKLFTDI